MKNLVSMKLIIWIFFLTLSASVFSQNSEIKSNKAKIVVIRSTGFPGSLSKFRVYLDMQLRAKAKNNKYLTFEVESGKHKMFCNFTGGDILKRKYEFEQIEYNFEPDVTYYFYLDIVQVFWLNKLKFVEITKRQGELLLQNIKIKEQE
jgi:hypothetical protein